MAAAINVPLSQELYSELSLKKKKTKQKKTKKKRMLCLRIMVGRLYMRGIYFTFFLKVPDGGIELMLGINKSTFAKSQ